MPKDDIELVDNPQNPEAKRNRDKKGDYALLGTQKVDSRSSLLLEPIATEQPPTQLIEFTFKIEGMTCVACSGSIERLMNN